MGAILLLPLACAALAATPPPRDPPTAATAPQSQPPLDDLRLSNDLYFRALRDYRAGAASRAAAKLQLALKLNPANLQARLVLDRLRQELAPSTPGAISLEAVRAAQGLYFEALRAYGRGRFVQAEATLERAAGLDPADVGIASALAALRHEMALLSRGVH